MNDQYIQIEQSKLIENSYHFWYAKKKKVSKAIIITELQHQNIPQYKTY